MLTLDPTTLFYWDIIHDSTTPRFETDTIAQWVDSQRSRLGKHSVGTGHSVAPSLTNQSTVTATSIHTSALPNAGYLPPPKIHMKPEPDFEMDDIRGGPWSYDGDGVISERDETEGQEHEEAVKSPPKGSGVRLTSEVCHTV